MEANENEEVRDDHGKPGEKKKGVKEEYKQKKERKKKKRYEGKRCASLTIGA